MSTKKKLVVIGGGAAGFFTAVNAALMQPNLDIVLLEKSDKLLSKVKISGGGRCNITNHCFDISILAQQYPRGTAFLKKAFHQFNTKDTIQWFTDRGVALYTEPDGRIFPLSNDSQTVIDCLLKAAKDNSIKIIMQATVLSVTITETCFQLNIKNKDPLQCDYLCIASGGYPKIEMFHWMHPFINGIQDNNSIRIKDPVPSLFTFNLPRHPITQLMGIAVKDALVKIKGTKWVQQGPVLITHWGLSGPAVLKLSAFAALDLHKMGYQFNIVINWVPQYNETSLLNEWKSITGTAQQFVANHNPFHLPVRLWDYLLEYSTIDGSKKWQELTKDKQNLLIKNLTNFEAAVKGKTTFKEEFVTSGGVVLAQIDHLTMQHKFIPNLFFAGEVLDIDGITGGFNFQNAWTTGYIAASAIAISAKDHQTN